MKRLQELQFNETEFAGFFAGLFPDGFLGRRELRLCPAETDYLRARHPGAALSPRSEADGDGKAWFEVCFER